MVRFAWRRDIGKKAKIMVRIPISFLYATHTRSITHNIQRKVKFATEFDALDIVTDELKSKLAPVSSRLKAIEKERAERRKVRKRTKVAQEASSSSSSRPEQGTSNAEVIPDVEMAPADEVPGDLEEESVYRTREARELEGLVSPDLTSDYGCSVTGLYDLVGKSSFSCRLSQ
jgi:ubiquitin carboxyl-terminal hydrolase 14